MSTDNLDDWMGLRYEDFDDYDPSFLSNFSGDNRYKAARIVDYLNKTVDHGPKYNPDGLPDDDRFVGDSELLHIKEAYNVDGERLPDLFAVHTYNPALRARFWSLFRGESEI